MNTYGQTACPKCGSYNNMYRDLSTIKRFPSWDNVKCYCCNHKYKHTDKFNNAPETEAERVRRERRD